MTNLFSVSALFIMYREALEACVVISVMLSIMGRLGLHRLKRQGDPPPGLTATMPAVIRHAPWSHISSLRSICGGHTAAGRLCLADHCADGLCLRTACAERVPVPHGCSAWQSFEHSTGCACAASTAD